MLNVLLRSYFKRRASRMRIDAASINLMRQRLENLSGRSRDDRRVVIGQSRVAGVPVEIVEPAQPLADLPTIVYLHGGAFVAGSPRTHRAITRRLAHLCAARVVVPDYRLAPEHCYPHGLDDTFAVYRGLLDDTPGGRIALAGDSAGGNLVLALLLRARDDAVPMPAAAMMISPWTDLTGSGESVRSLARVDAMLPAERLAATAELYAAGADLTDPLLSPLFGDFRGLPPMLVHVGTSEILLDDARRLVARAHAVGVDAQLRLWRGLPHVFHAFADHLPAACVAIDEIALFLGARLRR